jgi:glycopeptide antibiotics resistance protein
VEALQFFTGIGALDVDDLVLNLMGILLGYLLWLGTQSKKT